MNDIVKVLNGVAFAESQIVGPKFGKTHKHTLEKIDKIIEDLTAGNGAVRNFFIKSEFKTDRNREYRNFMMTRDGFALLAMSFTGPKAMKFKVQFIEAFNKMEAGIKKQAMSRAVSVETRKTLTDRVKESGENERMHGHGYSTYTKFAYKLAGVKYIKPAAGTNFRDTLEAETLDRVENIESMIQSLLKAGRQYDEVKKTMVEIFEPKQLLKG